MDQTYGKNFDANMNKGGKNIAGKGMKDNMSVDNMKNLVNEGFESLSDTFENVGFDWKTILSGIAVLGAIGAVVLSRSGRGSLKSKIGKSVGGYIGGHKASHSHSRGHSGGHSRSSSSRRSSSRASSAH
jgi:hypothetical protein